MSELWEIAVRHGNRLEEIQEQARLRDNQRIRAEEFDVVVERLRGENEQSLTRLRHELDISTEVPLVS